MRARVERETVPFVVPTGTLRRRRVYAAYVFSPRAAADYFEPYAEDYHDPGLIKSIHGGGGKGTAKVPDPSSAESIEAGVLQVLNEMKRTDGIYFETKVNTEGDGTFFQLELECDGHTVANGGRFVWFNSRLQKVVEIGLSDEYLKELSERGENSGSPFFMPYDLYEKSRVWAADVAKKANNNTRATMEALVYNTPGKGTDV